MTETTKRLLDGLGKLAPDITARGAQIEAGRRIPHDLVEALRSRGFFRMLVPQSHGGLELDLPSALDVIRALGRIDGSVGWNVMASSVAALFASRLPRETYQQVYENGPDVISRGRSDPFPRSGQAGGEEARPRRFRSVGVDGLGAARAPEAPPTSGQVAQQDRARKPARVSKRGGCRFARLSFAAAPCPKCCGKHCDRVAAQPARRIADASICSRQGRAPIDSIGEQQCRITIWSQSGKRIFTRNSLRAMWTGRPTPWCPSPASTTSRR